MFDISFNSSINCCCDSLFLTVSCEKILYSGVDIILTFRLLYFSKSFENICLV